MLQVGFGHCRNVRLVERVAAVSDESNFDLRRAHAGDNQPVIPRGREEGPYLAAGEGKVVHLLDRDHGIFVLLEPMSKTRSEVARSPNADEGALELT